MAKHNTKDGLRSKRELLARMDQLIVEAVEYRAAIAALKEEVGAKEKKNSHARRRFVCTNWQRREGM